MGFRHALALILVLAAILPSGAATGATSRPWPDTTSGIHVFNDQLTSLNALSDEEVSGWSRLATQFAPSAESAEKRSSWMRKSSL